MKTLISSFNCSKKESESLRASSREFLFMAFSTIWILTSIKMGQNHTNIQKKKPKSKFIIKFLHKNK